MKEKVVITKNALRELVNELLDDRALSGTAQPSSEPKGAKVNPVVDPSAAETDPMNPDYKPQNATEFGVAIRQLVGDMSDDQAPRVFDVVKQALNKDSSPPKEEKKEKDMEADKEGTKTGTTEAAVRKQVRVQLRSKPNLLSQLLREFESQVDDDERYAAYDDAVDPEKKERRRRGSEADDPASFSDIAKREGEDDASVAGIKQFFEKGSARARFMAQELERNPKQFDAMINQAFDDYIDLLAQDEGLSPEDITFLRTHKSHMLEMEGFRSFVTKYIREAMYPVWYEAVVPLAQNIGSYTVDELASEAQSLHRSDKQRLGAAIRVKPADKPGMVKVRGNKRDVELVLKTLFDMDSIKASSLVKRLDNADEPRELYQHADEFRGDYSFLPTSGEKTPLAKNAGKYVRGLATGDVPEREKPDAQMMQDYIDKNDPATTPNLEKKDKDTHAAA